MSNAQMWPLPSPAFQPDSPRSCPSVLGWVYPDPSLSPSQSTYCTSLSLLTPPLPGLDCHFPTIAVWFCFLLLINQGPAQTPFSRDT